MAETPTSSDDEPRLSTLGGLGADDIRHAREGAIVDTAAKLFLSRGVVDVKMTDVADACGLGVATLYRYFGTKTNLVIAVGVLLWHRFAKSFDAVVSSADYEAAVGCDRLRQLFGIYVDRYRDHPEFISFIDEFDHLMLADQVTADALVDYETEVERFFPAFEEAYRKGQADGSVTRDLDFPTFYRSMNHALIGVAQKLIRGAIIPSDDFSQGQDELQCLIDMAIGYLAGRRT